MGPSGSGKTTFLGVLAGLDPPMRARFVEGPVDVVDVGRRAPELRQHGIGVVFQSFGLLPALTALENVELPLRVNGADLAEARRARGGLAARLGLETRMHNRTYELSAGQQQRVAVARADRRSPRS